MPHYRAYVLDGNNTIQRAADYDYDTDDLAVAALIVIYPVETIELWSGSRRVIRLRAGAIVAD